MNQKWEKKKFKEEEIGKGVNCGEQEYFIFRNSGKGNMYAEISK